MKRDALAVVQRLRDADVAQARDDLAAAGAAERRAGERLDAHRQGMLREQAGEQARGQGGADGDCGADFAAWFFHARGKTDRLRAELAGEEARTASLRRILAERRVEAEAVAKVRQRRDAEALLTAERREQAAMDEAAGRRGAKRGTAETRAAGTSPT